MIRPFNPDTDLILLVNWLKARNLEFNPAFLSEIGVVADECAMGFLTLTNTRNAFIEYLVSDPEVSDIKTGKACIKVVDNLVNIAKEMGFTWLTCSTSFSGVKNLAINHFNGVSRPELTVISGEI